ncbi:hypothetical protein LSS_16845 [Leptospira santarosai serovar Shermani str. LT 821]|uniref:Uncharacterized protein n=1 Tax=Leptospira santarosai serovar Shermani str. LT 821 TaxID=758847 RepID=K8XXF2_9LEPT|nr:hypothetical protein LSS_16845 [Leptospira santarosai serovar Shermani str. LT 821]
MNLLLFLPPQESSLGKVFPESILFSNRFLELKFFKS